MERKNGFLKNLERFFAGKGFYIVLFLCMAVIGVSAWAMLTGTGSDVDDVSNISAYDGYIPTAGPLIPPADNTARVPDDPQEGITSDSPDTSEAPVQQLVPQEPDIQTNTVNEPQDADSPVMAETNFSPSFIWPLAGEIETPYSETALLYNKTMADWRTHDGIDVAAELGAQVMTVSSGRVERHIHGRPVRRHRRHKPRRRPSQYLFQSVRNSDHIRKFKCDDRRNYRCNRNDRTRGSGRGDASAPKNDAGWSER